MSDIRINLNCFLKNQTACGHPTLNRLSDNSISGQKHVMNKASKAFKSKKKELS